MMRVCSRLTMKVQHGSFNDRVGTQIEVFSYSTLSVVPVTVFVKDVPAAVCRFADRAGGVCLLAVRLGLCCHWVWIGSPSFDLERNCAAISKWSDLPHFFEQDLKTNEMCERLRSLRFRRIR